MPTSPEILFGFMCELIRIENSGQATAIGLWGSEWRLAGAPPVIVPAFTVFAFVDNPDQILLEGECVISVPGLDAPIRVPISVPPTPGMSGTNIVMTTRNLPLNAEGTIRATINLGQGASLTKELTLRVRFMPN